MKKSFPSLYYSYIIYCMCDIVSMMIDVTVHLIIKNMYFFLQYALFCAPHVSSVRGSDHDH